MKICGLTRREDALLAADLGATYVGFVLWPQSPRAATLEAVRDIIPSLPASVTPVGVFVNPTADEIRIAAEAGIRIAQVHADGPTLPFVAVIPVIRAVHLAPAGIEPDIDDELVLLDAHDPVKHGGTGKTIDWPSAARVAATRQVVLAGGLTAQNVGQAIATVKPFAVDVASGVEASPGIKDHAQLRAFMLAVRKADTSDTVRTEGER